MFSDFFRFCFYAQVFITDQIAQMILTALCFDMAGKSNITFHPVTECLFRVTGLFKHGNSPIALAVILPQESGRSHEVDGVGWICKTGLNKGGQEGVALHDQRACGGKLQ